jgi:hypothetical protein
VIYIKNGDWLTDNGLKYLRKAHRVDLIKCNNITDIGLDHLREVPEICFYKCKNITRNGVRKLRRNGIKVE